MKEYIFNTWAYFITNGLILHMGLFYINGLIFNTNGLILHMGLFYTNGLIILNGLNINTWAKPNINTHGLSPKPNIWAKAQ